MTYIAEAYVIIDGVKEEKAFTSEYYRGARWKAMRWINGFLWPSEYKWTITEVDDA